MAKSANQKLKLLYIVKILQERTDEKHVISTQEIIDALAEYDISAERKSIYNDIAQLQQFGYDIVCNKSKVSGGYALVSREFELPELKLLVDAVQASKFITLKKSRELIKKLEAFVSKEEAKQLQRQVYVANRIKANNESIYINVDTVHRAIQENKQIQFKYFEWSADKQMRFRKDGETYLVSPFALTFSEENYYLIAYEEASDKIKHYRVDKMVHIGVTDKTRLGKEKFEDFDLATYSGKTFSMFGGQEETVGLEFSNELIGVIIDRFGKEITIRRRDENTFSIRVKVAISGQFFGWLTGLGSGARIISPTNVCKEYQEYLQKIMLRYD